MILTPSYVFVLVTGISFLQYVKLFLVFMQEKYNYGNFSRLLFLQDGLYSLFLMHSFMWKHFCRAIFFPLVIWIYVSTIFSPSFFEKSIRYHLFILFAFFGIPSLSLIFDNLITCLSIMFELKLETIGFSVHVHYYIFPDLKSFLLLIPLNILLDLMSPSSFTPIIQIFTFLISHKSYKLSWFFVIHFVLWVCIFN